MQCKKNYTYDGLGETVPGLVHCPLDRAKAIVSSAPTAQSSKPEETRGKTPRRCRIVFYMLELSKKMKRSAKKRISRISANWCCAFIDQEGRADEIEKVKQEQIQKQKEGRGEWHDELASNSESIVRFFSSSSASLARGRFD